MIPELRYNSVNLLHELFKSSKCFYKDVKIESEIWIEIILFAGDLMSVTYLWTIFTNLKILLFSYYPKPLVLKKIIIKLLKTELIWCKSKKSFAKQNFVSELLDITNLETRNFRNCLPPNSIYIVLIYFRIIILTMWLLSFMLSIDYLD